MAIFKIKKTYPYWILNQDKSLYLPFNSSKKGKKYLNKFCFPYEEEWFVLERNVSVFF